MTESATQPSRNGSSRGPRTSGALFREVGQVDHPGRRIDGRTYDRYEPNVSGSQAFYTYEEMLTDPTIGGVMLAIEQIIRNVSWWVEPAGPQPKYIKAAEFLEENRTDMSDTWPEFVIEAFSMLPHGWSFHETVYKYRRGFNMNAKFHSKFNDGLIGWRKHPIRSQESVLRWEFDDEGDGVKSFVQNVEGKRGSEGTLSGGGEREIPLYPKGLLFRTRPNRRSPEGRSILRSAYRPWYLQRRLEEIEGIGIERELAGLPVLTAPEGVDLWDEEDEDMVAVRREATQLIKKVRANEAEGLLLPFGWEFQLASTGGSRAIDVSKTIERYNRWKTIAMLADFITLGHESVGSFSLADVKTNLFAYGLSAWLDVFTEVLNNYAVPRLFSLNPRFPQDKLPQFRHGDTEAPDLNELSGFITSLTGAGVIIPGPEIEEYVRSQAHLPPIPEERKELHQQAMQMSLEQRLAPPVPAEGEEGAAEGDEEKGPMEDPTKPVSGPGGRPATARQQASQSRNGNVGAAQGAGMGARSQNPAVKT